MKASKQQHAPTITPPAVEAPVDVGQRLTELKAQRQQLAFDVQNGTADPAALDAVERDMLALTRDAERAELVQREGERREAEARKTAAVAAGLAALARADAIRDELVRRRQHFDALLEPLVVEIQETLTVAAEGAALARAHEWGGLEFANTARSLGGRISWLIGRMIPLVHPGAVNRVYRDASGPHDLAADEHQEERAS